MYKFAVRYIKRNKKNNISIIAGIAFSVMLMFSLMQMADSFIEKYKQFLIGAEKQDFTVKDINKEIADNIHDYMEKNHSGEIELMSTIVYIGDISFSNKNTAKGNLIAADEKDIDTTKGFEISKGKYPKEPFEIAIEESINSKLETPLSIGDKVILPLEGNNEEFILTGFMKDTILQGDSLGELSYVFTSFDTLNSLPQYVTNSSYKIDFLIDKDDYNYEKIQKYIDEIYPIINSNYEAYLTKSREYNLNDGPPLTDIELEEYRKIFNKIEINSIKSEAYIEKDSYDSVGHVFTVLSIIIAFSMILLIFNSINLMFTERIKQYGALRCIGMSKKQLCTMLLIEVLFYSIIGISIGLVLGIILNSVVGEWIMNYLINEETILIKSFTNYVKVIVLAIISIFIACSKVFIKIRKLPPIVALNYSETNNFKARTQRKSKINKESKLISLFVNRNILRNKGKSITVFTSLVTCITLFMIIVHTFLSIKMPEKNIKESFSDYEVVQRTGSEKSNFIFEDDIKDILKIESVNNVYALDYRAENSFENLDGKTLPLLVLYNNSLFEKLIEENPSLKGIDYKNNDVVLLVNDLNNKDETKSIEINNSDVIRGNIKNVFDNTKVNDSEIELNITKTADIKGFSYSGPAKMDKQYFIINENVGKKIYINLSYNDVMIDIKGSDITGFGMEISQLFKNKEGLISGAYSTVIEQAVKQLYAAIVLALYIMISTAIVGFLNMRNTIKVNIINRRREYGILRAVGMERKILNKIVCLENIKLSLYASVFSSLMAIVVCMYINSVIEDEVVVKYWIFIVIGILAILYSFLVSYFEVKKGEKNSIISKVNEN